MNNFQMSSLDIARTNIQVNELNKKIGANKAPHEGKTTLGKDSFLKLLVTQLKHQDPTRPMEDKEFISQMAQFSSLEQMTNLNKEIKTLLRRTESSSAFNLLGKKVDSYNPKTGKKISGTVSSVKYNDGNIKLVIGRNEVSLNDISAVHNNSMEINKKINISK